MTSIFKLMGSATIALMLTAGVVAQNPGTTSQNGPAAGERVTISGCIERADQLAPTGTASATVDSLDFVLIAVRDASDRHTPAGQVTGTTGTAGAAATAGTAGSAMALPAYRLDADVEKLNPHVGHKVEVVGMVDRAGAPGANPSDSPLNAPRLKVESVKMLAETCNR